MPFDLRLFDPRSRGSRKVVTALLRALAYVSFGLALVGVVYTVLAALNVRRFFAPPAGQQGGDSPTVPVTLLKPLHGFETGLFDRIEGFLDQDDTGPVRIVFGSDNAEDPALALARSVTQVRADRDVLIVVSALQHGANRKISNIINMMNDSSLVMEPDDLIILSDSDIGVGPAYLRCLKLILAEPDVGVVTCPYYGEADDGLWSELGAMGISYQFLPNVVTGVSLGLTQPCMGSTIALKRSTLDRIGGFAAFRDTLADDYAIGAAVRGLGLKSVVAPLLVSHSCSEANFGRLMAHELRWARTVMGVDPPGYLGSIVTHPIPLAILAAILTGFAPSSVQLFGVACAVRLLLVAKVDRVVGRNTGRRWLLPLRDVISLLVFTASFFVSSVNWRGVKFAVTSNGRLINGQVHPQLRRS